MRRLFHKLFPWRRTIWPAVIWTTLIFFLLIIPSDSFSNKNIIPFPHVDKLVHFILFGVFAILWDDPLKEKKYWQRVDKRVIAITLMIMLYGGMLEYLQMFVGREMDLIDWLADILGILLLFMKLRYQKSTQHK